MGLQKMHNKTKTNTKKNTKTQKKQKTQKQKQVHWNLNSNSTQNIKCSPVVRNRTIVQTTCYTPDAITVIKDAYNKEHPNEPILAKSPKEIWTEIQSRFTHCSKEDCWLEQIKDAKIRKQLDEMLFAPDQPPEWKQNPNEWLSNFDIAAVLKQYEQSHSHFKLLGPTPIDYDAKDETNGGQCVWEDLCSISIADLHKKGKTNLGIVFNLDPHYGEGLHWTSMFVDMKNAYIYYYDSALYPFPKEVNRLKKEIIKQGALMNPPILFTFKRNTNRHQKSNSECGMYSLFFIVTFLTGETEFMKNMSMKEKLDLFSKNKVPDKYVEKYRMIYFNT